MIRLSIIIPAYNVAPWIEATLSSICCSQGVDLATVEIVVVNDGSTDNTAQVVEAFIKSHPSSHILLVQQSNQGVSVARNHGLHEARGEYVWFVDGDDMITSDALCHIFNIIRQHPGVDVIRTGIPAIFSEEPKDTRGEVPDSPTTICCNAQELFNEAYNGFYICHVRNIWRRELLMENGLEYPVGITTNEDFVFTIQSILKAKTAVDASWLNVYLVRKRQGSATHGRNNPERFMPHVVSALKALRIILNTLEGASSSSEIKKTEGPKTRVRNLIIAMNITHILDPMPLSFVRSSMKSIEQMGAFPFTPEPDHSRLLRFVLQRKWAIIAVSQIRRIRYLMGTK